jgi:hypothetical protein
MKKNNLIITSLLIMFAISCTKEDGGNRANGVIEAAVPNVVKTSGTDTALNLKSITNGTNINLGLTIDVARGNVKSMDLIGFYTQNGKTERGVLKKDITSFPSTVNLTQADLFNAFKTIKKASDINFADKLVVTTEIALNNGTIIKVFDENGVPNYGADISNSLKFATSQTYVISCPLDDASAFNGDYKVVIDDWNDYAKGDIVPVVYDPALGKLKFKILCKNDAGLINAATNFFIVEINPVDSSVKVTANEGFDYGDSGSPYTATGAGSVASCTGDINLKVSYSGVGGVFKFNLVKI